MKRFWNKVKIGNDAECWLWEAASRNGYGCFWCSDSQRMERAHRVSYKLTFGNFDERKLVCHKCNTPLCVNPSHLYLGDKGSNAADCSGIIGRHSRWYEGELWLIRKLHKCGFTQLSIGKMFKVNQSTISDILSNPNYPTRESIHKAYKRIFGKDI